MINPPGWDTMYHIPIYISYLFVLDSSFHGHTKALDHAASYWAVKKRIVTRLFGGVFHGVSRCIQAFLCVESSQLTRHSNPTVHIRGPIAILCVKASEPKFQLSCCRRAYSWSRYVSVLVPCRWNDREKAPTERGKTLHQVAPRGNYIYMAHILCSLFEFWMN